MRIKDRADEKIKRKMEMLNDMIHSNNAEKLRQKEQYKFKTI
jgi:hypothetical protein